ncbi:protein kinase [Novymonas esmeraldas]|uniref:Protein kinase n=1 Tax=Novymonas esmeraldas TaxID=1808958 RepID=A0AAW0EM25_9TRYP
MRHAEVEPTAADDVASSCSCERPPPQRERLARTRDGDDSDNVRIELSNEAGPARLTRSGAAGAVAKVLQPQKCTAAVSVRRSGSGSSDSRSNGSDAGDNNGVDGRPGSPWPHHRRRQRGPPIAAVMPQGSGSKAAVPRQRLLRPASEDSIAFSIVSSTNSVDELDDDDDEEDDNGDGDGGADGAPSSSSLPLCGAASPPRRRSPRADDEDIGGDGDGDDAASGVESMQSSPAAVTLWGVGHGLRRKRIKKVSHYILGPLLGEGSYGAVRDCIDTRTDNVDRCFTRRAIKIVNSAYTQSHCPTASPSAITAAAAAAAASPSLTRTSGAAHRRGDEDVRRRQEVVHREMLNLQRFHSKNILRAIDTFTRYSKEYVVMPIAICDLQQLVRQLLRTRWREAVRDWRRAVRRVQRAQRHHTNGGESNGGGEPLLLLPMPTLRMPMVPSAVAELDLDDFTFMADDDDDDAEDEEDAGDSDSTHSLRDSNDDSNASLSDCETGKRGRDLHHSGDGGRGPDAATATAAAAAAAAAADGHQHRRGSSRTRRRLPRIASDASSGATTTTTTTTTTRTIDSYTNRSSGTQPSHSLSPHHHHHHHRHGRRSSPRGDISGTRRRRRHGWERAEGEGDDNDDSSDHSSVSTTATTNGIAVMSATPPALSSANLHMEVAAALLAGAAHLRRDGDGTNGLALTAESPEQQQQQQQHLLTRPRLPLPLCSPTLLKGIVYQVISGVAYLHQQGVAHNDIKPANVLLFEDGTVKLADLGSVSDTYNDQGSPLCASPELCKYFYGAVAPPPSFSATTQDVGHAAARPSDMWSCGLLIYYLITGKPGPLPVHLRYFVALHSRHARLPAAHDAAMATGATHAASAASSAPPPPPVTRYQLYHEIGQQTTPVDLSGVPDMLPPDMGDDVLLPPSTPTLGVDGAPSALYPPTSVRHLLAGLLELDPERRLTADQALRHPWLRMAFRTRSTAATASEPRDDEKQQQQQHQQQQRKPPSKQAMEEAIQRDVARRVMESRHVQHMLQLDRQRHLQFVADCCNTLHLTLPPEIIKTNTTEPYRDDAPVRPTAAPPALQVYRPNSLAAAAAAVAGRGGPRSSGSSNTAAGGAAPVTGTVLRDHMRPRVMPPGCVDAELFLPSWEESYYERKSGKSEFDVRVLRRKPLLVAQLDEYLHNVVLVQCGYRTGPDPLYQAMRVRAVPIEDDGRGRRRRGGGGGGGGAGGGAVGNISGVNGGGGGYASTQQPSIVILPGASGSVYRRTAPVGLSTMTTAVGDNSNGSNSNGGVVSVIGAAAAAAEEDVYGAGPRHHPRVHGGARDEDGVAVGGGTTTTTTGAAGGGRGSGASRTGASPTRPPIDASLSGAAAAVARAVAHARSSGAAAHDAPAAAATVVRASSTRGSGGRATAARGRVRGQHDASDSPSEEEANVAMRESSKCLCGLV